MGSAGAAIQLRACGAGADVSAGTAPQRRLPAWGWWAAIVVGLSLPSFGFTPHPQWNRVHIVPFTDPEDKPRDELVNIGMFVPLGYLFARGRTMPTHIGCWERPLLQMASSLRLASTSCKPYS